MNAVLSAVFLFCVIEWMEESNVVVG